MNTIQKALEMQDVYAGWAGNEPTSVNQISKSFLEGNDDAGYPRIVRSSADTGNVIKIGQLKADYKTLLDENAGNANIRELKIIAQRMIFERYPQTKQNNMITRSIILTGVKKPSSEEKEELLAIYDAWSWIDAVKKASNDAESTNTNYYDANWPK